jgi:formylglycine-generating enzyme required for sulfatase activity
MDTVVDSYGCNIKRSGGGTVANPYIYTVASDWANRPVNYVSFWDAARFTNWLHNGQGAGNTEDGAYTLTAAGIANNTIVKNAGAQWWVPSEDEWYKAAYNNGGSTATDYFRYPASSNGIPSNVLGNPTDPGNNATYSNTSHTIGSPYYRTEVGAHENSDSPYGTFDQGGNVWEWNDIIIGSSSRLLRGGSFSLNANGLASSTRYYYYYPTLEINSVGFRVASVPEPCSLLMTAMIAVSGLLYIWRKHV